MQRSSWRGMDLLNRRTVSMLHCSSVIALCHVASKWWVKSSVLWVSRPVSVLWVSCECSVSVLRVSFECPTSVLRVSYECPTSVLWVSCECLVSVLWVFCECPAGVCESPVRVSCESVLWESVRVLRESSVRVFCVSFVWVSWLSVSCESLCESPVSLLTVSLLWVSYVVSVRWDDDMVWLT